MNYHPENYRHAYGTWKVTTEGDEEGKTTRNLGVYVGSIDDIAFALADKCYYCLEFTPFSFNKLPPIPTRNEVNIMLDIDSGTWDMNQKDKIAFFKKMIGDSNTKVENGQFYASVKLSTSGKNIADIKKEGLAKLTEEEKYALGVKE